MLSDWQARVKLDIDRATDRPPLWVLSKKLARAGYRITLMSEARSPSGKGWHITLDLKPKPSSAMEVVALQAVLGGDPWREAMQITRARAFTRCRPWMREMWNVLYLPDSRRSRKLRLHA